MSTLYTAAQIRKFLIQRLHALEEACATEAEMREKWKAAQSAEQLASRAHERALNAENEAAAEVERYRVALTVAAKEGKAPIPGELE